MASRFVSRVALLVVWPAAVMACVAWLGSVVVPEPSLPDPDYMWRPLGITDGAKVGLGLVATAATVGACLLLRRWFNEGVLSRPWLAVFIAAGAIGAYGGIAYEVATAPVIGANIGGGMVVLFAGPFIVGTAIGTAVWVHSGRRTPPA